MPLVSNFIWVFIGRVDQISVTVKAALIIFNASMEDGVNMIK